MGILSGTVSTVFYERVECQTVPFSTSSNQKFEQEVTGNLIIIEVFPGEEVILYELVLEYEYVQPSLVGWVLVSEAIP